MEKFSDECGIVAIIHKTSNHVANRVFYGLSGMQHRGQESAGLAVVNSGVMSCFKKDGLVSEVFNDEILSVLKGNIGLGHVRYSGEKDRLSVTAQPYVVNYKNRSLAVAYNGGIVNYYELRQSMEEKGAVFTSSSDCELISLMTASYDEGDIGLAIAKVMKELKGGYAIGIATTDKIIGVRDALSIRPLAIGKLDGGYVIASESTAFDMMNVEFVRDVKPGEIVIIDGNEIISIETKSKNDNKTATCIFEYVYFARPDSTIDGINVYQSREIAGRILATESPVEADIVIGVPDSGTPSAIGFATKSNIPYSAALIKNKYIGRTFIEPTQEQRETSVRLKLNPICEIIKGKRIVLVDDSIIRGTTMKKIVASFKNAGASEVHLRISSPPVYNSCFFGVDTPDQVELIANNLDSNKLCDSLGVDSLAYISVEGLLASVEGNVNTHCTGCFSGDYPINVSN